VFVSYRIIYILFVGPSHALDLLGNDSLQRDAKVGLDLHTDSKFIDGLSKSLASLKFSQADARLALLRVFSCFRCGTVTRDGSFAQCALNAQPVPSYAINWVGELLSDLSVARKQVSQLLHY